MATCLKVFYKGGIGNGYTIDEQKYSSFKCYL